MIPSVTAHRSFLLALVAAASMAGCSVSLGNGPITVTKPFNAKVTAKSPADVHVDVPVGTVTVQAGPEDSTEVSVTGTLGGANQEILDAVEVAVAQGTDGITEIVAKGPQGKSWKADLTITTPAKTSLTVKSGVGTVNVSGLEGRTKAEVGVGNLNFEALALTGDSRFTSGTGNVTLGITAWPKDSALTATSGVGKVTVRIPEKVGLNVDAATGVGNLRTKGLKFQGEPRSKTIVGGTIKGRTESEPEGRSLKATSGTGDVNIESEG